MTSIKSPPLPPPLLKPPPPPDLAHLVDAIDAENQNISALSIASASRANAPDLRPPSSLPNLRTHSSRLKEMDALRDKSSSAPLHRDDDVVDVNDPRASGLAAEARRPKSETAQRRKGKKTKGDKPAVTTNDRSGEISARSDVSLDKEEPSPIESSSRSRINSDPAASVASAALAASLDHDFSSYPRLSQSPPSKDNGEYEAED